ncbi:alpha/beta hydrolase [Rhizobium lentis]|uniref:Alpha/beta hydrolase n=1 Tax=Rhizobium lentis TaxID=1138194 RepID=A0ABS7I9E8_9HYPH|nr:alpha/beta hydrolase [Rhizobium lentis]MBX5041187.1 alpha/beta hydrolase [Rhizobium lentis]MBX5051886.1 alpha/beta hydrolase [Rhizobium lentis]MBX5071444.1 alpha/beta hydrolase [Rhizobium lentis]MBX5088448.1 alpha/beta hydrolase [Rhizobium lentis]MBX5108518.1 alpha/beta hydrolase [Rhizobium lentis]
MLDILKTNTQAKTEVIRVSPEEQARESALRQRFADFWASATTDLRTTYDRFISASPLVDDVTLEAVDEHGVKGWWVRSQQANSSKAILYIHGGGYVLGSAKAYRGFVSQIVTRTGVAAFILEYPLAPEASLPTAPSTALAAWDWLRKNGFDQIAIVGDSAGGGLSLVTLTQLSNADSDVKPVAGVVFSPWADLTFSGASMLDQSVVDPLIGYDYLKDCAQKYLGSFSASDPLASPLLGELQKLPPLLIQVGTDERLLDDSRQFAQRAAEAGVSVELELWEGMHHVFQLDVAHIESARAALDHAAQFLHAAFNRK